MGKNKKKVFDLQLVQSLRGVPLPPKLRCDRCERHYGTQSFSEVQLNHARVALQGGKNASYKIKCRRCCGGQPVEIPCKMCDKTKGLEEFAKSQRAKPDDAECMKCVEERVALEAVNEDDYEDPLKAFLPLDFSGGVAPDYWGPSTHNSTTSNTSVYGAEYDEEDTTGGISTGFSTLSMNSYTHSELLVDLEDNASEKTHPSWSASVHDNGWSTAKKKSSGFDPNKYGNPASRSASVSGTERTWNSNFTERSDIKASESSKWAKVKAYKPEPSAKPMAQDLVEDEVWDSSEEEDNDDDGDQDDSDDSDTVI